MACTNCGNQVQGVGQIGVGQAATTGSSSWMPWVLGGVAVLAVGGGIWYATGQHHSMAEENPTRKKSPGEYRQAIVTMLMHRYGFSAQKAWSAVNDPEIGWKVGWFFMHNYNVAFASRMIHRRIRRNLYPGWKQSGYMPLYKPLPPYAVPSSGPEQMPLPGVAAEY